MEESNYLITTADAQRQIIKSMLLRQRELNLQQMRNTEAVGRHLKTVTD